MNKPTSVLPALAFFLLPLTVSPKDLRKEFEDLDAKGDSAGIVELWRKNPGATLSAIDSYLEGSLREIEKKGDPAKAASMHARALRGAKAAAEAFDAPIFLDYASSFVGWNAEQQKNFRAGQKAFKAAAGAMQAKDFEGALKQGNECIRLARPLGDWWGTAMGLSMVGQAEMQRGRAETALDSFAQARLINHDLRLLEDELECMGGMVDALLQLNRAPRALACAEQGLALAEKIGSAQAKKTFEEKLAKARAIPAKKL